MDTPAPSQPTNPNHRWIAHLRALTAPALGSVPIEAGDDARREWIESFADEYGNRRATDRPFLAHLLGVPMPAPDREMALDEALWWMIQAGRFDADAAAALIADSGALVIGSDQLAIEYRTMVELCALHGLWLIATRTASRALKARCLDAAAWHTRELQPDNAINRPWAVQVFIHLAISNADDETRQLADLHAQTLIHNACVSFGRPDLLGALILKDAGDQLSA